MSKEKKNPPSFNRRKSQKINKLRINAKLISKFHYFAMHIYASKLSMNLVVWIFWWTSCVIGHCILSFYNHKTTTSVFIFTSAKWSVLLRKDRKIRQYGYTGLFPYQPKTQTSSRQLRFFNLETTTQKLYMYAL